MIESQKIFLGEGAGAIEAAEITVSFNPAILEKDEIAIFLHDFSLRLAGIIAEKFNCQTEQ